MICHESLMIGFVAFGSYRSFGTVKLMYFLSFWRLKMGAPPLTINDLEPLDCSSYALNSVNLTVPPGGMFRVNDTLKVFMCLVAVPLADDPG